MNKNKQLIDRVMFFERKKIEISVRKHKKPRPLQRLLRLVIYKQALNDQFQREVNTRWA